MNLKTLFVVTAVIETGAGLVLLFAPSLALKSILGDDSPPSDLLLVHRVLGVVLIALGVACWRMRANERTSGRLALLIVILTYNVGVALLLGYVGGVLGNAGAALWPTVLLHSALAVWCVVRLVKVPTTHN